MTLALSSTMRESTGSSIDDHDGATTTTTTTDATMVDNGSANDQAFDDIAANAIDHSHAIRASRNDADELNEIAPGLITSLSHDVSAIQALDGASLPSQNILCEGNGGGCHDSLDADIMTTTITTMTNDVSSASLSSPPVSSSIVVIDEPAECRRDDDDVIEADNSLESFQKISTKMDDARDQSLHVEEIDKLKLSSSHSLIYHDDDNDAMNHSKTRDGGQGQDVHQTSTCVGVALIAEAVHVIHAQSASPTFSGSTLESTPVNATSANAVIDSCDQRRSSLPTSSGKRCLIFDDDVEIEGDVTSSKDLIASFVIDENDVVQSAPLASSPDAIPKETVPGHDLMEDDALTKDLSPLQHPNPYPIPHLDSPEDEDDAKDVDQRGNDDSVANIRETTDATDAFQSNPETFREVHHREGEDAPVFERGISPSSVKLNRSVASASFTSNAQTTASSSSSGGNGVASSTTTPGTSPRPSPRLLTETPSAPNHPSSSAAAAGAASSSSSLTPSRNYDYILKFLLVGDSDVGKDEILSCLSEEKSESPYDLLCNYKTTTILIDGKRVKLQLWDTSGQGRFCTILRSYSRGAQGILLVYDITNKWSFDGIARWLKEVDEHAPGVPKILVGNRLHLAYKRQVCETLAEHYAAKNDMSFFEVSPLCDFNIVESFTELSRVALQRNGMARLLKSHTGDVSSLQDIAIKVIVARTTVYSIDQLPLPGTLKQTLKSYSIDNRCNQNMRRYLPGPYAEKLNKKSPKPLNPSVASPHRGLARIHSCCIS